jgi:hypothetical protein
MNRNLYFVMLLALVGCTEERAPDCLPSSCPVGQVCGEDGGCVRVVCSRHQCVDAHTAGVCVGRLRIEPRPCADNELCLNARCQLAACQPGQFRCAPNGERERCLDNGQGYEPGPCDAGSGCHEGACLPLSCTRQDNNCLNLETLLACNQTRTAMLQTPCEQGLHCSTGACRPVICSPGDRGCASGSLVGRCNAAGTGWNVEQLCDRQLLAQCHEGQCLSRCELEGATGASYLGCSYRPVELPNLRGLGHDEHPFAVTVGNSSSQNARLSVLEPGDLHQVLGLSWRSPVLCDDGNCSGANNRELNDLAAAGRIGVALTFEPADLRGEYASGAIFGLDCPEDDGRCMLRADAPGGALGDLRLTLRDTCSIAGERLTGPCFISENPGVLSIAWGDQRLDLQDALIAGRLNAGRTQITEGRIAGLLSEAAARRLILPATDERPRRYLAALLDPANFQELSDEHPAGWRVELGYSSRQRVGEVPARAISRRELQGWVPALGGQVRTEVRSEVLLADGSSSGRLRGAVQQVDVPPDASGVFLLHSERRATVGLEPAGFRVVSSVPVSAFQFNPLCCNFNYSNDASLLLPDQAAGRDYVILSQPHFANRHGFFSVVAVNDGTRVQIELPPSLRQSAELSVDSGGDVNFDEEGRASVVINAYQSLTLRTRISNNIADLSGTRLRSEGGGILVYAGHEAMQVPSSMTAPDHLEEMIPPLNTWGRSFVVARPILRNPDHPDERTYYRLLAGPNGSKVTIDEPEGIDLGWSGPASLGATDCRSLRDDLGRIHLQPLEVCGVGLRADFLLQADRPILIGQLLAGQEATGLTVNDAAGDPSFSIVPPVDQLRAEYLFTIPPTYARDYVTIAAPASAELLLDGVAVDLIAMGDPSTEPYLVEPPSLIGDSSWMRFTLRLGDGAHRIESSDPSLRFTAMVYAFDTFVSYAFPAGMNLTKATN